MEIGISLLTTISLLTSLLIYFLKVKQFKPLCRIEFKEK